jgi:subtilisin family serine protease
LEVEQAHRVATGKNIAVALIDSEIDVKNPNLDGVIVKNFDALGGDDKPHQHGTAMAGAIAAHGKIVGIAPGAQLLAARAFDEEHDSKAKSSAIYKSLQWAADNGARVVNMSFAGPADPTLHRLLAAATDKGLVLIAAAGNAGPSSPPLYPGADPNVIAVTATDSGDAIFAMANRGNYIAVAAPGVDILALAPGDAMQLTTGTSVATAHVSGLAALLLECKPSLKPTDIRAMLAGTAKPLGSGAKLVNAYRAVTSLNAEASGKDGNAEAKQ